MALFFLALLAVATAWLEHRNTVTHAGEAVVVDGDSLRMGGEEMRMRGIDAPEFRQTCRRAGVEYACGREARDMLRSLVRSAGQGFSCTGFERDKYERLLVRCRNGEGLDLNGEMVRRGWAIAYGDYRAEEAQARTANAGLWAGDFTAPSGWREVHGGVIEVAHDTGLGGILRRIGAAWQGLWAEEGN